MDVDGTNPVQLTRGNGEDEPSCSADGRWVYYASVPASGLMGPIRRVPLAGGDPELFLDAGAAYPVTSPDHRLLAYDFQDSHANPPSGVAVVTVEGKQLVKRLGIATATPWGWAPDGRGIAYVDDRYLNVWAMPLGGGRPTHRPSPLHPAAPSGGDASPPPRKTD